MAGNLKNLIKISDVVSNIVSLNLQKKLSMCVAWLFDNLVGSVFLFIKNCDLWAYQSIHQSHVYH